MFYSIAIMVALISESLGLLLASRLSLIVSCTNVFCYEKRKLNSLLSQLLEWNVRWAGDDCPVNAVSSLWHGLWE